MTSPEVPDTVPPALFDGAGTPSRVEVLALFDAGAPTPPPRPAPAQCPGQLGLL